MKNLALASLTKVINTYLKLDAESTQRFTKLHGKAITIELMPLHLTFQCLFTESGVVIQSDNILVTDATIRGTPLQLMGVMFTKENRQRFFADDVVMEGNAEFGQQVVDLFDELHIDWEEHASRVIGDVPAHHIGRLMRDIKGWLRKTDANLTQDISDYIHEEVEWLPTREALQDFFLDIDTLRMDVDRIDARIKKLDANLTEGKEPQ
jgi:ubiquinone biosynthesis protein UbiJ